MVIVSFFYWELIEFFVKDETLWGVFYVILDGCKFYFLKWKIRVFNEKEVEFFYENYNNDFWYFWFFFYKFFW